MSRTEQWSITEDGCTRTAVIDVSDDETTLVAVNLAAEMGLIPNNVRVPIADLVTVLERDGFVRSDA